MAECGKGYGFASWCKREAGHDGLHAAHNLQWSDEDAEQSRLDIIRQMRGKTE